MGLFPARSPSGKVTAPGVRLAGLAIHYTAPVLLTVSLAAFAVALRPPRPPLRRLAREPGFVALAVVVLSFSYYATHFVLRLVANYRSTPSLFGTHYLWMLANGLLSTGWDIAIAWTVLALQGNWRRLPAATGVLGVAIGILYIAISTFLSLLQIFETMKINYF
jgi:hypothetical protein